VDLDVLVRHELLTFLKKDSEVRGATILYATHIFDGLKDFPTHVAHIRLGSFVQQLTAWPPSDVGSNNDNPLYDIALKWLIDDREHRRNLENQGRKVRGARRDEVPIHSETFYKKYDYSH